MLVFDKICVRTKCMIPIALIQPQINANTIKRIKLTWAVEESLGNAFGQSCHVS